MRGNLQSATEDKLGEDLATERRRLSPVKLPGLNMDASLAQQCLGMQPSERSKVSRAHSATEGSFKALQERQPKEGMSKESGKGGKEVCYLCMQQEERRLQAARREELARRHRAPLEANISKTEKKKTTEESRESLRSYCPTPPASVRRRQYDRELQERKEAWGKEPKRKPAQLSLQHHKSLPARQSHRQLEVAKAWWQEPKNRGEQNPCKAHSEEQLHCMGGKMPLQPRRRNH
ncbi:inner centromere protein-like [Struthio camelus]|uniref:inner centromere protein-like n=1 Tax=Struthio camelus TaxID=8801 RepID=UPI00360428A1